MAMARRVASHAQAQIHPGSLGASGRSVLWPDLREPAMAIRVPLSGQNGHPEPTPASDRGAGAIGGMRLVEVGLRWPPETFLQLKLTRLADRGIDVIVCTEEVPPGTTGALHGVRVEQLAGIEAKLVGALRPDVLHFEWLTVASSCLPFLEEWPGPIVVSLRGSDLPVDGPAVNRPPPDALERVFARADAVHCVAESSRREALAFGLDPENTHLIPGGVDVEFFKPPPAPAPSGGDFTIVSVGFLRWLKGHEYAVSVLAELVRQGVPARLEVLGGDPTPDTREQSQRARILHTASDLGVGDRVRLHGYVEPAGVCAQLQSAHALLHPSLSEGLPNAILEAMACGVPVVASDVDGTREAIRDGVDGFLVPPRDAGAAAAALRNLWEDAALRTRMGEAGRARVESGFTVERHTDQWIELYERVTAVA
jgi:glycosyltransferase involved in cell wall biosynthesis